MIEDYGLDEAASALHAMMEQLPICCLIKDEQLRYRIVNARFCDVLGREDHQMIGRRATELFDRSFAERIEANERRVLDTDEVLTFEESVTGADGAERHYITRITPIASRMGNRFVCVALSEVTELNAARREAESADRLKSEFLATMSHELRTPMNGVLGLAQILKETELDCDQRRLVDAIVSSGEGLMAVISDILDVSVIEAGQMRLSPAHYEVEPLVEDTVRMMTPAAEAAGLRLFTSFGPNAPIEGVGDAARIRQVLTNFIGNAVKFTETGHIEVRCEGGGEGARAQLVLAVTDTGIGVPEKDQAAIFERFSQAKGGRDRPRQGVGLGLAICRSLAEMMGGDVALTSVVGEGSTFTFSCALNTERQRARGAPPAGAVARIIDPYQPRAAALRERLANWGWSATGAGEDVAALHGARLRPAEGDRADVLIVAIDGPPGPCEAEALKAERSEAPVIFLTPLSASPGGVTDADASLLAGERAFEIVPAPAGGPDLRGALERALKAASRRGRAAGAA